MDNRHRRVGCLSVAPTGRESDPPPLEPNEETLRLALDAAEIGIWDYDVAADLLTWSDRMKAMFGLAPNAPCSLADFYQRLHPADFEATAQAFADTLDPHKRAGFNVEYRTIGRDDGVVRWVGAKGRGIFDAAGRCVRAVGMATDISGRRAFEAPLCRSEGRLAEAVAVLDGLLANAPMGFAIYDREHRYVRVSRMLADNHGLPPDAHIGRQVGSIIPEVAPSVLTCIDRVIASGQPLLGIENDAATPIDPDEPRSWLMNYFPVVAERGEVTHVGLTVIDITERRRAERLLRDLNAELETRVAERTAERDRAWNNAQDLLLVVDRDARLRAVNPAWTKILGWRTDELIGRGFLELIHPDDRALSWAGFESAGLDGSTTENRYRHKDGTYRWIAWISGREGDLIYGNGRHITAEKEAAIALAQAEEQLRQSQKMEAVGQLAGGIAHDFNNLLTGIIGSLELLERRVAAGRLEGLGRYTAAAMGSAQRAAALTQRLLAFARQQPLVPKRVDPNRLIAGMEELLGRTLGPGIELNFQLGTGLWPILCDPNQLESAILNLAINARDAMPEGGQLCIATKNTQLEDRVHEKADSAAGSGPNLGPNLGGSSDTAAYSALGEFVAIEVADTGIGMSEAVAKKIFDPFFTTKPAGQGTGLGLSMLYGFVRQSGGQVRVQSQPGEGTVFRLYLPRCRHDQPDRAEAKPVVAAARPAKPGETVLVVEDEATIRLLVTETFRELGYTALEASDGIAGLAILQSGVRIDLLVTDIGLPGMDGRQLMAAARAGRPGLRTLLMTGYIHDTGAGRAVSLEPGIEIIAKPFTLEALMRKLRDLTEAEPTGAANRAPQARS